MEEQVRSRIALWVGAKRLAQIETYVLVYGYGDVDLDILEEIVRHHVDNLLRFMQVIRGKL
jgi:hypothetical protein